MFKNNKMQYVIKTCSSENTQELQNLLNEMSMNGWELYSMHEMETDDGFQFNCIFMCETKSEDEYENADEINISSFKSQMEKMLSPRMTPYENCLDIQSKIRTQKEKMAKIKKELEGEAPASVGRKKLNEKISAGLKELEELKEKLARTTSPDVMYAKLKEEKLSIHLSEELLGFVDTEQNLHAEELVSETVKSRLKLTEELGYIIPKIIFQDDETLNPCEFSIRVRGLDIFKGHVYPDYVMFFVDDLHLDKKIKNSVYDFDFITGKKIVWIEKDKCKDFWQKGIMGTEFIARALEFCAIKYVDELLDYADADKYVDVVDNVNPFLIENIIPEFISLADLRYILTSLIREEVSVKNITYIFEKLNDYAQDSIKSDLLKKIRLSLSRQICKRHENEDGNISAFEVSDKTLDTIMPSFDNEDDCIIKIDGSFAEKIAGKIKKKAKDLGIEKPIIVVPMECRYLFFTLLSHYLNTFVVLAREEICNGKKLEIIGIV